MEDNHLEKSMRILSDLVAHCHWLGAEEFQMYMTHDEEENISSVTVSCPMPHPGDEVLGELRRKLQSHRQREVEQNYWELSGESEMSGELSLVGMMIDDAKVGYKEGVLYIHVWRKD